MSLESTFGFDTVYHLYEICYQTIEPQDIMNCLTQVQIQQPAADPEH